MKFNARETQIEVPDKDTKRKVDIILIAAINQSSGSFWGGAQETPQTCCSGLTEFRCVQENQTHILLFW